MSPVPRKFDHDEARARHAAGETLSALAREYGVSATAVQRVVNPKVRERMHARTLEWHRDARVTCRGGCGRLVWSHGKKRRTGYCPSCLGERRRVEQHGTETGYNDQGCRCEACTAAATDARRRRRHARAGVVA